MKVGSLTIRWSGSLWIWWARYGYPSQSVPWLRMEEMYILVLHALFYRDRIFLDGIEFCRIGKVQYDGLPRRQSGRSKLKAQYCQLTRLTVRTPRNPYRIWVTCLWSRSLNITSTSDTKASFPSIQTLIICIHLCVFVYRLHCCVDLVPYW